VSERDTVWRENLFTREEKNRKIKKNRAKSAHFLAAQSKRAFKTFSERPHSLWIGLRRPDGTRRRSRRPLRVAFVRRRQCSDRDVSRSSWDSAGFEERRRKWREKLQAEKTKNQQTTDSAVVVFIFLSRNLSNAITRSDRSTYRTG